MIFSLNFCIAEQDRPQAVDFDISADKDNWIADVIAQSGLHGARHWSVRNGRRLVGLLCQRVHIM